MPIEPVVGDRYTLTWKQLGEPKHKGDVDIAGLGTVVLDDADVHFGRTTGPTATFFVRQSEALGGRFVVVSRQHKA